MPYFDRYGGEVTPDDDSVKDRRRGVFALMQEGDHVLLTWQHDAIDTPQLPGGGVEAGEDDLTALSREIYEEAGMQIDPDVFKDGDFYEQHVGYYADNQQEFWDYHQVYVHIKDAGLYFEGEKKSPEDGAALWVPISSLDKHPLQAMHKRAIDHFLK